MDPNLERVTKPPKPDPRRRGSVNGVWAPRLPAMARTGSLRGLKFFDSQFDSVAWKCLSLCRDAEAMRIAVVVGKEKLGLPVVSLFEF